MHSYALLATSADGWPLPTAAAWVSTWLWVLGFTPFLTLGLLLFPTGSPAVALAGVRCCVLAGCAVVLPILGQALRPGRMEGMPVDNPLGWRLAPAEALLSIGFLCFTAAAAAGAASLVQRWRSRRSGGPRSARAAGPGRRACSV